MNTSTLLKLLPIIPHRFLGKTLPRLWLDQSGYTPTLLLLVPCFSFCACVSMLFLIRSHIRKLSVNQIFVLFGHVPQWVVGSAAILVGQILTCSLVEGHFFRVNLIRIPAGPEPHPRSARNAPPSPRGQSTLGGSGVVLI